jgi:hypothetical protein
MSETGRLLLGTIPHPEGGGAGRAFRKTLLGGAFETRLGFIPGSHTRKNFDGTAMAFCNPSRQQVPTVGVVGGGVAWQCLASLLFGMLSELEYMVSYQQP